MKKIEAIIRPEKLNQVKAALESIEVKGMTVHEVRGRGEQRGIELVNRAGKYRIDLLPKVLLELVAPDEEIDKIVNTIVESARTGEPGDGKIFVSPIERSIRIRTGDENGKAL
jgi:nitrogen regulatory protein P-II 1